MNRFARCGVETESAAMPLVSVVIPVYNTQRFLAECLESIRAQSYGRWEAVIVDNCSTDESAVIAHRLAQEDSRFSVIRCTEFLPQLDNYNRALSYVSPDARYCKILEADNWIFPEFLARMVELAEREAQVGIVGSYFLQGRTLRGSGLDYSQEILSGREVCRMQLLGSCYFWGSPTSLLYRADMVRSRPAFFDTQALHGDVDVCYELLQTWKFGFVHQVLSFERVGNEGITSSIAAYHPTLLREMMDVHRYGPIFLTEREQRDASQPKDHRYQNYLGLSVFWRPWDRRFWERQRQGMSMAGIRWSRVRIGWWAVRAMVQDVLLEPKALMRWLARLLRQTGTRTARRYGGREIVGSGKP